MSVQNTHELVILYTQAIVSEVAPEEQDLFDELIQDYLTGPPPAQSNSSPDDPLGFGVEAAMIAATPIIAAMVMAVLNFLLTEVITAVKTEASDTIRNKIKGLLRPKTDSNTPSLTLEQMKKLKTLAVRQGVAFGLDKAEAEKMANALIGVISTT